MNKKIIALTAVLMLGASVFAGCGCDSSGDKETPDSAVAQSGATQPTTKDGVKAEVATEKDGSPVSSSSGSAQSGGSAQSSGAQSGSQGSGGSAQNPQGGSSSVSSGSKSGGSGSAKSSSNNGGSKQSGKSSSKQDGGAASDSKQSVVEMPTDEYELPFIAD